MGKRRNIIGVLTAFCVAAMPTLSSANSNIPDGSMRPIARDFSDAQIRQFLGVPDGSVRPIRSPFRQLDFFDIPYSGTNPRGTLIVDVDQRRLYFINGNGTATSYPIAVARDGLQLYQAEYYVGRKATNPRWTPTPNMRQRNPNLPLFIQGGHSENPLGTRAIYFYTPSGIDSFLRAHGTNAPQSIGTAASSGCFRMYNGHVEHLYPRVEDGARIYLYENVAMIPGIRGQQALALNLVNN